MRSSTARSSCSPRPLPVFSDTQMPNACEKITGVFGRDGPQASRRPDLRTEAWPLSICSAAMPAPPAPSLSPLPPPASCREAHLRSIAAPVRYRLLPRFVLDTVWGERMKGRQGPFPRPQRVPASGSSRPFRSPAVDAPPVLVFPAVLYCRSKARMIYFRARSPARPGRSRAGGGCR